MIFFQHFNSFRSQMRIHDRKELYLQIDSMQWYSIYRGMRGQVIVRLLDWEVKCTQIIWVTFCHSLHELKVKKSQNSHQVVYMDEKLKALELYLPGLLEIPIPNGGHMSVRWVMPAALALGGLATILYTTISTCNRLYLDLKHYLLL